MATACWRAMTAGLTCATVKLLWAASKARKLTGHGPPRRRVIGRYDMN